MKTLRETASDEIIQKFNELTDPIKIRIVNQIFDRDFGNLTYLDSTFLRDIFRIDLNLLCLNFNKNYETDSL